MGPDGGGGPLKASCSLQGAAAPPVPPTSRDVKQRDGRTPLTLSCNKDNLKRHSVIFILFFYELKLTILFFSGVLSLWDKMGNLKKEGEFFFHYFLPFGEYDDLVSLLTSPFCHHFTPLLSPHAVSSSLPLFIPSLLLVPVLDCPLVAVFSPSLFSSFLSTLPLTVQAD